MPSHRKFPLSTVLNFQRVCTGEPREPSELQCSCLAHLLDLSLHATPIALLAECLRTAFPCLSWYWHQSQQATPTPSLFRCEFRFIHFIKKVGFFLVQETIRITHPLESPPTVRKEHPELTGDPQPPLCKRDVHLLQERGSPAGTHPALSPYFWAVPACTQDIHSLSPIGNRAQVPPLSCLVLRRQSAPPRHSF